MLSQPFETQLHMALVPGVHYVEIAPDLSDLRDKVNYYLAHHAERERIALAGREFSDNDLSASRLARYYVSKISAPIGYNPLASLFGP